MAITYNDLYLDIRRQLRAAGSGDPTLEARELVAFACGKTREELLRDGRLYVTPEGEERVRSLVRRHLEGEPTAYLIGEWEFYGLPLDISRDVLVPRPDTEVLAELAIRFVRTQGDCRVLDLCAGSGCVGLAVASRCPGSRGVLGELSEGALRVCRQNVRRNGLSGRVVPMQMDALAPPPAQLGEFRCLVANPPYIPAGDIPGLDRSVKDYEPHMALDGGAARTVWISTGALRRSGGRSSPWAEGSSWRWASARRTTCCGCCGRRASGTWKSPRTSTASPGWSAAPSGAGSGRRSHEGCRKANSLYRAENSLTSGAAEPRRERENRKTKS